MPQPDSLSTLYILIQARSTDPLVLNQTLGQVSAFEPEGDLMVARAAAIARNFEGGRLTRNNTKFRLRALNFLFLIEKMLVPPVNALRSAFLQEQPGTEYRGALKEADSVLRYIERSLTGKLFILGIDLSFADVGLFCVLIDLFILILHPALRKSLPETTRWFGTMLQQPEVNRVVGTVSLCPQPAEFLSVIELPVHGYAEVEDESSASQLLKQRSETSSKRRRRNRSTSSAPQCQ